MEQLEHYGFLYCCELLPLAGAKVIYFTGYPVSIHATGYFVTLNL
ncbi:MAG: hypothetical protein QG649_82 [Patescibacteria group bacterium]|nr:hypothetical protein [Patescibacteria group bacterium]